MHLEDMNGIVISIGELKKKWFFCRNNSKLFQLNFAKISKNSNIKLENKRKFVESIIFLLLKQNVYLAFHNPLIAKNERRTYRT